MFRRLTASLVGWFKAHWWTTALPTEPGAYWHKYGPGNKWVAFRRIFRNADGRLAFVYDRWHPAICDAIARDIAVQEHIHRRCRVATHPVFTCERDTEVGVVALDYVENAAGSGNLWMGPIYIPK